jgi:AraC family transcriptional regulator of adaptative response/methylated-DNA-[protein]-cysteine methyltransferase
MTAEKILKSTQLESPLGSLFAIADDDALYVLEFGDFNNSEFLKLSKKLKCNIVSGNNKILSSIENELKKYFDGKLTQFKTPLFMQGTDFQKRTWHQLTQITYGTTRSYLELAKSVGNRLACRAVARANSTNPISIVVPCHRVINHNGNLGGYAGGIDRKQWLLDHESKLCQR